MAASDLQKRVEYLVSFSSQLIFVCGSGTRQSQVLNAFLTEQTDNVEVAVVSASTTTPLASYREKIYRQLVSTHDRVNFSLPLNQLLVPLNQHDGPVLISISKAENLPKQLLKELWEVVLQSRFANNKQLLNVLLFADESWAKQAKNGLTSRSGEKPVLLNSAEAIQALQHAAGSELDKMILAKRKQFAQRLQQRGERPASVKPLSQRKWLIGSLSTLFIAIFTGILAYLYAEQITEFYLQNTTNIPSESTVKTLPPIDGEILAPSLVDSQSANVTGIAQTAMPQTDTELAQQVDTTDTLSTPDPLVTDWHSAIRKVDENANKILELATPTPEKVDGNSSITEGIPANADSLAPSTIEVFSMATATVSPLDNEVMATVTPANVMSESAPTSKTTSGAELSLQALLEQHAKAYVIQLSAMHDVQSINEIQVNLPTPDAYWQYQTLRFGGDWWVLLHQQFYPSLEAARQAISQLPQALQNLQPFVKSVQQVRQEISLARP
jgi:DamX protein